MSDLQAGWVEWLAAAPSARIGASFVTKLFRHAYPGGFSFVEPMASVTNSSLAHPSFVSDSVRTVQGEI